MRDAMQFRTRSYFIISSRSSTDLSNFIRMVVRDGHCDVGVLWAVTRAGCSHSVDQLDEDPAVLDGFD